MIGSELPYITHSIARTITAVRSVLIRADDDSKTLLPRRFRLERRVQIQQ